MPAKGNPSPLQRFWSYVNKTDDCWVWVGPATGHGYGHLLWFGRDRSAHRVSWELANGPIPDGLHVCHRCDVRLCVNPDHLFLGSAADNQADMTAKGRGRLGAKNGLARLTAENVIAIRRAYHELGVSQESIAAGLGVSQTTISRVLLRQTWKHL
jgi:hypothetical protein